MKANKSEEYPPTRRVGRPEDHRLEQFGETLKLLAKKKHRTLSAFYAAAEVESKRRKWEDTQTSLKRRFEKAFFGNGPFPVTLQDLYDKVVGLPDEVRDHLGRRPEPARSDSPKTSADEPIIGQPSTMRLLHSSSELHETQMTIVREADHGIFAIGSRSRNIEYLSFIEERLRADERFRYYRVLHGAPKTKHLEEHLVRTTGIRDLEHHIEGRATLCIGIYEGKKEAECNLVCNQKTVMIALPTTEEFGGYTTALRIDDESYAKRYCLFVHQFYLQSNKLSSASQITNSFESAQETR